MKHVFITLGLILFPFVFVNGQEKMFPDSMYVEVLLNEEMMNEVDMSPDLNASIGLTSNNSIVLSSSNQFYFLHWGNIEEVGAYYDEPIHAFGYTPEGFLLVVQKNKLCFVNDTLGNLDTLYTLPRENMNIATGKENIYLFDSRTNEEGKYGIYVIAKGQKYLKLLEFPQPISAVEEFNGKVLFASKNKLFSIDINKKEISSLSSIPENEEIQSIAVNEKKNAVYLSSLNEIYSLKDNALIKIFDVGGEIKYWYNSLLVFYPGKSSLIRIVNFEKNTPEDKKEQLMRELNLRRRISQ